MISTKLLIDEPSSPSPFLCMNHVPVFFSEDWKNGIGGGLWSTGLAMAKYFQNYPDEICGNLERLCRVKSLNQERQKHNQKNIIDSPSDQIMSNAMIEKTEITAMELGSGNGFLSICLLAVLAHKNIPLKELVVTDLNAHLSLLCTTLKANSHVYANLKVIYPEADPEMVQNDNYTNQTTSPVDTEENVTKDKESMRALSKSYPVAVTITEHEWGNFLTDNHYQKRYIEDQKYDFIFGTDLAYRSYLYQPLISSLLHFSHDHTLSLIGVTMNDTQPLFFDLLTAAGFRYEKLADHLMEREFQGITFGIFAIQKY